MLIGKDRLLKMEKWDNLPAKTWYLIGSVTLSVSNKPECVAEIYNYVVNSMNLFNDRVECTLRIREAIMKSAPLAGVPKAINSLTALHDVTPIDILEKINNNYYKNQHYRNFEINNNIKRGELFWNHTYTKISKRVEDQLRKIHQPLWNWIIGNVYGNVLSDCSILNEQDTAIVVLSSLVPQDVPKQLRGHYIGAIRGGIPEESVDSIVSLSKEVSQWKQGSRAGCE